MMRKKTLLILLLLLGVLSCVRDVSMDAGEEPQVVVECVLTDGPVQTLSLVFTKSASRTDTPVLPEATVVLTDLTVNREAGRFKRMANGLWQLTYMAIPEHRYRLDVTVPGHEPIWAEQTMPEAPNIDVRWDWWRENLPKEEKYHATHGYVFSTDTLRSPVWFYGINCLDDLSGVDMVERLCTDFPEVDGFNQTESAYLHAEEKTLWGCWFHTSSYPDLEGEPYHRRYLRFPVRAGEKTEFLISGVFHNYLANPRDFIHSEKRFAELHWFSASEDYDHYLTDSWYYAEKEESSDFADVFLRENVYSNIQGAIGIFGAKVERIVRWDDDRYWGNKLLFFPGLDQIASSNSIGSDYRNPVGWSWDHLRPFQLLLFEVRDGYPEEWKYGIHTGLDARFYSLENEEQMRDHGIETLEPVDFSVKSVWVVYFARAEQHAPIIVANTAHEYETEEGQHVYSSHCVVDYLTFQAGVPHPTSSRIAMVVDKVDTGAYDYSFFQFLWGEHYVKPEEYAYFREILRQLGID